MGDGLSGELLEQRSRPAVCQPARKKGNFVCESAAPVTLDTLRGGVALAGATAPGAAKRHRLHASTAEGFALRRVRDNLAVLAAARTGLTVGPGAARANRRRDAEREIGLEMATLSTTARAVPRRLVEPTAVAASVAARHFERRTMHRFAASHASKRGRWPTSAAVGRFHPLVTSGARSAG